MTVPVANPYTRYVFSGPGFYYFEFKIFNEEDITVTHIDKLGNYYKLILDTDYSISIDESSDSGQVTVSIDTLPDGFLELRRSMEVTQDTDFVNNDPFDMEILERSIDRTIMILQDFQVDLENGLADISWMGDWKAGTLYLLKQMVVGPNTNIYVCSIEHTAGNNFYADLNAGMWEIVLDVSIIEQYKVDSEAARDDSEGFRDEAYQFKIDAEAAASAALNSANYAGKWETLTGAYPIGTTVGYDERFWILNTATQDITSIEPGVAPEWDFIQGAYDERYLNLGAIDGSMTISVNKVDVLEFTCSSDVYVEFSGFIPGRHKTLMLVINGGENKVFWPPELNWPGGLTPDLLGGRSRIVLGSGDGGQTIDASLCGTDYA